MNIKTILPRIKIIKIITMSDNDNTNLPPEEKAHGISFNVKAALFLTSLSGAAGLAAFGATLLTARREDPVSFNKGMTSSRELQESGVQLASRALKWGSLWAVCGVTVFSAGIWCLSGASNMTEFKLKMGSILPKIPKNNPPQSRTEFDGLTDLLNYVSKDFSKQKTSNTEDEES